jgi:hypothetical protein
MASRLRQANAVRAHDATRSKFNIHPEAEKWFNEHLRGKGLLGIRAVIWLLKEFRIKRGEQERLHVYE